MTTERARHEPDDLNSVLWRHVESLCHAALARPAGERATFLAEACGDDAALRVEVESLLAGADSTPSFLESPVAAVTSPSSLIGRQLGAYRIDSVLGAGGMGEVCRVKNTRLGPVQRMAGADANAHRVCENQIQSDKLPLVKILSVTEVSRNFSAVLDAVERDQEEIVLVRNQRHIARLVPEAPRQDALEVLGDLLPYARRRDGRRVVGSNHVPSQESPRACVGAEGPVGWLIDTSL